MEEISNLEKEDLLRTLKDAFPSEYSEEQMTPIESGNMQLFGSSPRAAKSYETIGLHLTALLQNQEAIDYATRAQNSPVFKYFELAKGEISKLAGSNYEPLTIDQLTEKQFDIIASLKSNLKDARREIGDDLHSLISYKENVAYKGFEEAIKAKKSNEQDLENLIKLHHQAVSALGSIKKSDSSYVSFAQLERNGRRRIQNRLIDISKANQELVFRDAEIRSLDESEDVENTFVLLIEQVERYASSSLDYARNRKRLYDLTSGGEDIILASQAICDSLSKTLTMQTKQLDNSMRNIKAIATKAQYKMLMPHSLMAGKGDYASGMIDVTKGINLELESQANRILEENWHPT